MQVSDRHYEISLSDKETRVAIITALFNEKMTTALTQGAEEQLKKLGVAHILHRTVPGAWELPLAAKQILQKNQADAVIACGCVIRGDTSHYDVVVNESARGLMHVALEFSKPVMNAVLTVENPAQAEARTKADPTNKGAEAARALVEFINGSHG